MTASVRPRPFAATASMLGDPCKSVAEVLDIFRTEQRAPFECEYKYDGQRAQIHFKGGGEFKIFSRHSDEVTAKWEADVVPFLADSVTRSDLEKTPFIIDVEIVAVDSSGAILPFQQLATRKRTAAAEEEAASAGPEVCIFAFDILYYGDSDLLDKPLSERKKVLAGLAGKLFKKNRFELVKSVTISLEDLSLEEEVKEEEKGKQGKGKGKGKEKEKEKEKTKGMSKEEGGEGDGDEDGDEDEEQESHPLALVEKINAVLKAAISNKCEGLMCKVSQRGAHAMRKEGPRDPPGQLSQQQRGILRSLGKIVKVWKPSRPPVACEQRRRVHARCNGEMATDYSPYCHRRSANSQSTPF